MAITTKPRGHVEVNNIQDDLPYQFGEMPNVLPISRIEEIEGLAYTLIVELVNDDVMETICEDDDEDEINESSQDDEEHDDNDMDNWDFE